MADARRQDAWNHTAAIVSLMFNINRDPKKSKPVKPEELNPYNRKPKRKKPSRDESREGFAILKKQWVDKNG